MQARPNSLLLTVAVLTAAGVMALAGVLHFSPKPQPTPEPEPPAVAATPGASRMHLFPHAAVREALNQGAAADTANQHMIRKLLLHPRAMRTAHEQIEQRFEQAHTRDEVAAATADAEAGKLTDFFQWVIDHWQEILQDVLAALRAFHVIP